MYGDYGTTTVAAKKQIESALVKSGKTGFDSGKLIKLLLNKNNV
jgi:hypothetical protein